MTDDRRASRRAPQVLQGKWGFSGKQPSRITALSVSGCYVESLSQPRPGERIHLSLELPEGELGVDGEVVYCEPRMGFALRFMDVAPEVHATLTAVVERLTGEDSSSSRTV